MDAPIKLPDGLYRYVWRDKVVGFVVAGGKVTACAPWLRARMANPEWQYRMTTAQRVGP